ncbi:hypothetical protein B0O79_3524 [Flavobacteriaceae bacterium MAR_2009_75]|nr:hypothetical protein B0O79_3524 [Flavobacteriaceae bacterium MAR_2009_75]
MHTKENPLELYGMDRTVIPFGKLRNHHDSIQVPKTLREEFIRYCDGKSDNCFYSIGIFDKMVIWRTPYELYYALYEFAHRPCPEFKCSKYFAFFKYETTNVRLEMALQAQDMLEKLYNLEKSVNGQKNNNFIEKQGDFFCLRLWNKIIKVSLDSALNSLEVPYPYLEFHLDI